jgi:hypothetical protein
MSDEIRAYVDSKLGQLEVRVRGIENSNARSDVHHENVEKRLSGIEGSLTWLVRLVFGSIVLAALAALSLKP